MTQSNHIATSDGLCCGCCCGGTLLQVMGCGCSLPGYTILNEEMWKRSVAFLWGRGRGHPERGWGGVGGIPR